MDNHHFDDNNSHNNHSSTCHQNHSNDDVFFKSHSTTTSHNNNDNKDFECGAPPPHHEDPEIKRMKSNQDDDYDPAKIAASNVTVIIAGPASEAHGHERARRQLHAAAALGMDDLLTQDKYDEIQQDAAARHAIEMGEQNKTHDGDDKPGAAAASGTDSIAATVTRTFNTNAFLQRVFSFMVLGLLVTAVVAYLCARSPLLPFLLENQGWFIALLFLEIAVVFIFALKLRSFTTNQALGVFLFYASLNGLTLSTIFAVYSYNDIFFSLICTSTLFVVLVAIGMTTKQDLSKFSTILFAALITLIIVGFINLLIASKMLTTIISMGGVVIFSGFTMYDTQNVVELGKLLGNKGSSDSVGNIAVFGALQLYLDFINLFLYLLSLLGDR